MEINKITNLLNLEHVKFLISIFKQNNVEIRLVGGCIRDALIEREIKDIDTQAFALLLGGIGRDFAKDSNIKKLISSPEQSANSITEIILNGIKLDKDYD